MPVKYRASLILASTLAAMLAVMVVSMALNGALTTQWADYYPVAGGGTDFYALEDGVFRLNINTASAPMLEQLGGIGEMLAARIVDYREANGPFDSVEDLKKVKGIGEKKLEAIRGLIFCG